MDAVLKRRQGMESTTARGARTTHSRQPKQPPATSVAQQPAKQARTGGGIIQSYSIQQQFAALSNDRDKFRKEKEQAEAALAKVQNGYQALKKEQDELTMKNFHAKAELGTYSKKLDMLKDEEKRTARNLENDTKAVESCTNHLKSLEAKKEEKDNKFVAHLNPITLEIAIFLQKRLEKKIEERISVQTVSSVILPFLEVKQKQGSPELQKGLYGLNESIDKLKQATFSRDEAAQQLREILIGFQELGVDLNELMEDLQVPSASSGEADDSDDAAWKEAATDFAQESNMNSSFYASQGEESEVGDGHNDDGDLF